MRTIPILFRARCLALGLGTLLAFPLLPSQAAQETKVRVPFTDLPALIKKAVQESLPAGEIVEIEKEVQGENPGQYDLVLVSSGKRHEIEISPEGKLLEIKEAPDADEAAAKQGEKLWSTRFGEEHCTFTATGRNRFWVLQPGHQLVLECPDAKVVITVLEETRKIGTVETRVVEEREEEDGELKEVSRNFLAICREHGDVFYFGEEVDDYQDGKIVGHSGAWRADEKNSKAGILMPGTILLGGRHYQEMAPNAMDRAEILRDDVVFKTPAGTFEHCLQVDETSGLDAADRCLKTYAPGIGLIQDEDLLLTRWRPANSGRP